ncbi:FMN-binding negative transcriptional regulator [Mycobacterium sp. NBC_00419]|uniref:FMN-binding negative transcriptional regulator n=1 Tax=Mycobacterium sp. NBC_00419 TaxID=2975989 RepID=UPI002E1B5324
MYVPAAFALSDAETASALGAGGFSQLITRSDDEYLVTPLPLLYRAQTHSLVGHVSRANPHWKHSQRASVAVIAGPQAYISPSLYATKAETGKVVPTWNYDVLVVHGRLVVHDDAQWVRELVGQLTEHHEAARTTPWAVDDAPADFVTAQLRAIVGVELIIERVEGKAKMSQNQPQRNQAGVVDGLRRSDGPQDRQVADQVEARNRL